MSVERAIVQFVSEGVPEVEAGGDKVVKINSDVQGSADKATAANQKSKETADEAAKSVHSLATEVTHTLHLLHQAAQLAEQVAKSAGVDEESELGEALGVAGGALSGAAKGARVGAQIGGAPGAIAGALLGGGFGAYGKIAEIEKKDHEREERLREFDSKQREHEITDSMLRAIGLAKADAAYGGPRRVE